MANIYYVMEGQHVPRHLKCEVLGIIVYELNNGLRVIDPRELGHADSTCLVQTGGAYHNARSMADDNISRTEIKPGRVKD